MSFVRRGLWLCVALAACDSASQGAQDSGSLPADVDAQAPADAGSSDGGGPGGNPGAADSGLAPALVENGTVTVGPIPAQPGDENTMCVVVDLGNEAALFVRELATHLEPGSHHMIVYRTDEALQPTPRPCSPSIQDESMLFIAQSHDSSLRYPDAAALMLTAHQHVRVEIHFFNDTSAQLDIGAKVSFTPHQGDTAGLLPVKTRFTGNLSLQVATGKTVHTWFEPMPSGQHFFAITTHTHRLGVLATLARATSESDPAPVLLHTSRSWAEPPLTQLDPPITFDGDGLLLSCHYDNPGAPVGFGTSALDEMCFLWGYYY